jgi:pimeloyl-ACP methyl ester carboxylesterase
MRGRKGLRAVAAIALLLTGFLLTQTSSYQQRAVIVNAGDCRMEMDVVEPATGAGENSVILFHGLSANRRIMSYIARGFAEQGLRVFVPDLPGHGRTPGPFTPQRAEECAESLVRGLLARGMIDPQHTVLAGHSMGGTIAARVASRARVAGVIAISPAPMQAAHGVWPEMLLFKESVALPPNSLVVSGGLEPEGMRSNATQLLASRNDGSAKYEVIPYATHVSLLFTPSTVRVAQEWTAHILHVNSAVNVPSLRGLLGSLLGFAGLLLLSGPFIREVLSKGEALELSPPGMRIGAARVLLEIIAVSAFVILCLKVWLPLRFLHLFEGDYLLSFFLIAGLLLLLLHKSGVRPAFGSPAGKFAGAAFAGMVLHLLTTGWFDLTATEAWITSAKWMRFPAALAAVFPFSLALEIMLGRVSERNALRRLAVALGLLLIVWLILAGGVRYLHSGEILLALLAPYFALFFALQRMGADLVRRETRSAAAAAVFGAILLAGFCLVLFPVS